MSKSQPQYIERPPRIQPELPMGEQALPEPPSDEEKAGRSLIQVALPLITIAGYILISVFGSGRSMLFVLPMGLAVVASVGVAIWSRRTERLERERKQAAYADQLLETRNDMVRRHDMQRRFYRHNTPDLRSCLAIAQAAHVHMNGQPADPGLLGRLWERRPHDEDFGAVRVGMGTRPSTVTWTLSNANPNENPLARDAMRLVEDSRFVEDVPISIQLRRPGTGSNEEEENSFSATHAIGITGNHLHALYGAANALLVQHLTFHSPADSTLLVLGRNSAEPRWEWVKSLPHCAGGLNVSWCFEGGQAANKGEKQSDVAAFLKSLRKTLDQRESRLRDSDNKADVTLPFLLLVIDLLQPLPDDSVLRDIEMDPAVSLLISHGHILGGAVLFLVPAAHAVPGGCQALLEVTADNLESQIPAFRFRYVETGVNTPRFSGSADILAADTHLQEFTRFLQPLSVRRTYGSELPAAVLMLEDVLGHRTAEELRARMRQNWEESRTKEKANWLTCALGMMGGGETRVLRFSADGDGVHGMIAGSTGSGKSELLMSMILNMAYRYDPSIVNFVLVDFKGGGAFKPLEGLPHVVQVVTNLSEAAVERMFAAITAELNRRQAINTTTDSKDIVAYRKQGLHLPEGPYHEGRYTGRVTVKGREHQTSPYPHLFVFIDEFAEMIASNPEYKEQLNSITRLGRALGVTLILAAQRPTGVTDQMRANIKFRIALRVETREESSEILRRPDAAYLPTGIPGRGYLQVGNENIELIQCAWTGNDYKGGKSGRIRKVVWPDRPGGPKQLDDIKVFDMMREEAQALARQISPPQHSPWPAFLPDSLSLTDQVGTTYLPPESWELLARGKTGNELLPATVPLNATVQRWMQGQEGWPPINWQKHAMRAVVGIIDNPWQAEQRPLLVDLRRGHLAVFGASGWGKTTFLQTLLVSLTMLHNPDDLHIYIFDFGGRQLGQFEPLPHVGAIITSDQEERVFRLLRLLDKMMDERKQKITARGYSDIYDYNNANPEDRIPVVLVVLENYAEFRENYEGLLPLFSSIARDSRSAGIHFVITAELPNVVGGKLFSFFTERIAFRLSDRTEYSTIVGRGTRELDEIPGRGYVQLGKSAVEFQAAKPAAENSVGTELDLPALVGLIEQTGKRLKANRRPQPIETLTKAIGLQKLLADTVPDLSSAKPFVGIEDLELSPWPVDFRKMGPHLIILGPPNAGITTVLRTLVLSLSQSYAPGQVMIVLIDLQNRFPRYGGTYSLGNLPHVVETIHSDTQLASFVDNLDYEMQNLAAAGNQKQLFVVIDNYDSLADEVETNRSLQPLLTRLARLGREKGTDGLHFVAGTTMNIRRGDPLLKQVLSSNFGLALQSAEGAQILNGRVPRSLAQAELPAGRAFCVKSGQVFLVQLATPFESESGMAENLDNLILRIRNRHAGHAAQWARPQDSPSTFSASQDATEPPDAEGAKRLREIRERRKGSETMLVENRESVDMPVLRQEIVRKMPEMESIMGMLDDEGVIQLALEKGLLSRES